ncbi:MAG: hypothetical protein HFG30_05180 [Eubacterium sp.]|jgi:hypothetical protein|nr:hypothetical protein [Eubacterium sp.]
MKKDGNSEQKQRIKIATDAFIKRLKIIQLKQRKNRDGIPAYIRICLYEYVETDPDAGINRTSKKQDVICALKGADKQDISTWKLYIS